MVTVKDIENIVVIGTGIMGAGIAQVAIEAGIHVTMVARSVDKCHSTRSKIAANVSRISKRRFATDPEAQADFQENALANLQMVAKLTDANLNDADIIIEAVIEDLKLKQDLFQDLQTQIPENCIIATNTSSFLLGDITTKMNGGQERVGGLHFFNPVYAMKLVEVVSSDETSERTYQTLRRFCEQLGKIPVMAKDTHGFIVNRLFIPFLADAVRMVERGDANPKDIDTAMKLGTGHHLGPFEVLDLIGLDVVKFVLNTWHQAYPEDDRFYPCGLLDAMVEDGKLGRKTGEGFHRYTMK